MVFSAFACRFSAEIIERGKRIDRIGSSFFMPPRIAAYDGRSTHILRVTTIPPAYALAALLIALVVGAVVVGARGCPKVERVYPTGESDE